MRIQTIRTTVDPPDEGADLLLCACGYESRATHLGLKYATRARERVALGFAQQQDLNYESNRRRFESSGFVVRDCSDAEFSDELAMLLSGAVGVGTVGRLLVDISCLNRARLARLVHGLMSAKGASGLDVTFMYNLAEYSAPADSQGPISVVEPVLPEFAGWTTFPDRPPAAFIGLGYEQSRAIGIVDHLEINNAAWVFVPEGPIQEYAESVRMANRSLLEMIGSEGRRLRYDVQDPTTLFRDLNSLVELLRSQYNPIIIPFGPKVFALVALLVASIQPDVGVWRVSSGLLEVPKDRKPSKYSTALRVTFA